MELIPEWAPNIHPMLVHFPIAILSIAILFDFIAFFLPDKQRWWTNKATAFLYGIGAATAIGVYFTGKAAANSVFLQAEAQSVLTAHEDWALWTVWFYGIYAAARILVTWQLPLKHRFKTHLGFFIISFLGIFLLKQTGDRGAKMVFKYGVGVQAVEIENPVQHNHETDHDESMQQEEHSDSAVADSETAEHGHNEGESSATSTSFNKMDNGDWTWEIGANPITALQRNFQWLTGSPETVNANMMKTNDRDYALVFSGENINGFFVGDGSYRNVQVDYYLDLSAFKGKVFLAYNVQDKNSFYFISISSGGTIKQGRMVNGEPQIFETNTIDVSDLFFVRAVSSGEHFRGYVDKELVVHGHGDAPKPGSVGIKINGSGTLLLKKMALTQLGGH